ncbi:MAG TPA: sensor histidine kinase [Sandaracinaceae bacterium]
MVEQFMRAVRAYRLTWGHHPDSLEVTGGSWGALFAYGALVYVPLGLVLGHPAIAGATGLSRGEIATILAAHFAYRVLCRAFVVPRVRASKRAFDLLVLANALTGAGAATAMVVATGDPSSLLWVAPVMYAMMNGALAEFEPSIVLHLVHVGVALAAIPVFLATGAPAGGSVAGPVVAAVFCAVGYHHVASFSNAMREQRKAKEREVEAMRERLAELERKRLVRDLHDSIGSALGVTALYAQLLEDHADEPATLRSVGRALRETAQSGLGDLRGMLEALDPAGSDVRSLAASLEWLGARAAGATGARVEVRCTEGGQTPLSGGVRVALVRIFQEALANALRHGRAECVRATLDARSGAVTMSVADDGSGFAVGEATRGKGLRGIAERAEELGGWASIESAPGAGTRVLVELPLDPRGARALAPAPARAGGGGAA